MQEVYTTVLGDQPVLFVPDHIMFSTPVLDNLGGHAYEGEVFFQLSATTLWGKMAKQKDTFELQLLQGDTIVFTCPADKATAAAFTDGIAFLLIGAPFMITAEEMKAEIEAPYELEQIQGWMRSKEIVNGLEEEDVNGLLIGVWEKKPFEE